MNVHNEFNGRAVFVIQAGSINAPVNAVINQAEDLDERAARQLARLVQRQWHREAGVRGLLDPVPLATRWVADDELHGDHEQLAGRIGKDSELGGDLGDFAEAFLALPHRRLVLLGDAGSGKSSVAVLLLLSLLQRRQPGDPVPVLFPLGSWDPQQKLAADWLAQRLSETYPALGSPADASQLLQAGLIAPVLDGLDEMSPHRRSLALTRLNETLADGTALILSCRTTEYDQLLDENAVVLRGAAVVRAVPVTPRDALHYLRIVVVPQRHVAWEDVFALLEREVPSPLLTVAANPLMLGLLRVYANGNGDPGALLHFDTATELEDFLLDALVPAVFPEAEAARAQRWLGWLAREMTTRRSDDLTWWQIASRVSRRQRALTVWVMTALPLAALLVSCGVLQGPLGGLTGWAYVGTISGIVALPAGLATGRQMGHREVPAPVWQRFHAPGGPLTRLPKPLAIGSLLVAAMLAAGWVVASYAHWSRNPAANDQGLFPLGLLGLAVVYGVVPWCNALSGGVPSREEAVDPIRALLLTRRRAFVTALGMGGLLATAFTALMVPVISNTPTATATDPMIDHLVVGSLAVVVGLLTTFYATVSTLWYAYQHARLCLALTGRLPFRLSAFLADAHRLGILRQVGPVYQFRHTRLRERLAAADRNQGR